MSYPKSRLRAAALVAVLMAALPAAAAAQMQAGLRGGVNFANVTGRDADNAFDSRPGFLGGAFLEAPFADIVSIELGLQYSQKGFKVPGFGSSRTAQLDYFEVPALLTVLFPAGARTSLALYAGPTFSFAVRCRGDIFGFDAIDCRDAEVRTFDLGGDVGAGLRFPLASGSTFMVDGFYDFGFQSFDAARNPFDMKNQVFSLTAGLMVPVGGRRTPARPTGRRRGR